MDHAVSWVEYFTHKPGGQFFIDIDPEYLNTQFNLYGLQQKVPNFKIALDLIRGPHIPVENYPATWPSDIEDYGTCLYGLLHARYLLTSAGLKKMKQKYDVNQFPACPRTFCEGAQCLPYGISDIIGQSSLKLFCPKCKEVYISPGDQSAAIDGAFFGPSWVHAFMDCYPSIMLSEPLKVYVPRIFGFRICPASALQIDDDESDRT